MGIFKKEAETKRVIFNIDLELAERLDLAKQESRSFGKKLDVDSAVNKALEKFLKKAEKKIEEMKGKKSSSTGRKSLTAKEEGADNSNEVDNNFHEESADNAASYNRT